MKIDKTNPRHWLYLVLSGINVLLAIIWRLLYRSSHRQAVVLYGHKYNGNLKAFADYCRVTHPEQELFYATLDPKYYRQLKAEMPELKVLLMTRLRDMVVIGQSGAIITDHGLHTLVFFLQFTNIRFIDVWHGIAYKGFSAEDFSFMHPYDEVWVSSPTFVDIYERSWGFKHERLFATGYARVDRLVRGDYSKPELLKKYAIPTTFNKLILVAPTWKQDDKGRSILPFNADAQEFFTCINEVAKTTNSLVIFRVHLNASSDVSVQEMSNIKVMSHHDYPQTEEFLFLADMVVSDWSSLLFDYLPLHRPTVFLDVPPPFRSGLTLGKDYRFGEVVKNLDQLLGAMKKYTQTPEVFARQYAAVIRKTEEAAYGNTLDGKAAARYYERLQNLLQKDTN